MLGNKVGTPFDQAEGGGPCGWWILDMYEPHMELMFLYARKNRASVTHYRMEINVTADEFLHRQARMTASIV
ncbi:MAG: hypothetical protein ACYDCF_07650 [Burkholderiales bacterium]